jgi:hypothetical protein
MPNFIGITSSPGSFRQVFLSALFLLYGFHFGLWFETRISLFGGSDLSRVQWLYIFVACSMWCLYNVYDVIETILSSLDRQLLSVLTHGRELVRSYAPICSWPIRMFCRRNLYEVWSCCDLRSAVVCGCSRRLIGRYLQGMGVCPWCLRCDQQLLLMLLLWVVFKCLFDEFGLVPRVIENVCGDCAVSWRRPGAIFYTTFYTTFFLDYSSRWYRGPCDLCAGVIGVYTFTQKNFQKVFE